MKIKYSLMIAAGLLISATLGYCQSGSPATNAAAPAAESISTNNEVMPLITIEEAPLPDAIKTLARQAGINIQFDPKVFSGTNATPSVTFRWENVSAYQALAAILENNDLQMVQDQKTRIARITKKEPTALEPLFTKVIALHYSNPTNVIPIVTATFGSVRSHVIADSRTGHLVIVATEKELAAINDILAKLDTPPSQILIEARFIETAKNPKTAKGVDWSGTLSAQNVSFGNNIPSTASNAVSNILPGSTSVPAFATTLSGAQAPWVLNADGVKAVLSFINSDSDSQTLATPRAVALEGTPVSLSVVQEIPIFEQQQGLAQGNSIQGNTVKPNYNMSGPSGPLNEVGVKLIVTPRIYGVSNVFLDLKPEISSVGPDATSTLGGQVSTSPTFLRKTIQTQAMVPTGNTLVLGGLRQDDTIKSSTKVPVFGDIPGLGAAFRSHSKERNKRDLLVFVTPTIVSDDDYQDGQHGRDFLKTKVQDPSDADWSDWDSTKVHEFRK